MRSIIFLLLLPFMLYPIAKRPFIALGMWIWTAMFFPNAWVYGIASSVRYNLVFAGLTIFGYLISKEKPKAQFGALGGLVLLFLLWTTISSMMTIGNPDVAWDIWGRFLKVVLLFVFVVLIVDKKLHVDFFLWCLVLSIGFYAGLEGLKFISSGGGHKIAGLQGHILGDRNELSVAFVMMLPICFYIFNQYGNKSPFIKLGMLGVIALLVISVIGTQSRGGFIALLAIAGYLFMKVERKGLVIVLATIVIWFLSGLVSNEWLSRMDTIENANEDASFMGRVVAWKLSFILAMNHPFFGGGFKSLETFPVWAALSQDFHLYPFFYTGDAVPNPSFARAAHSVYFQVLGEHGFAGLAIYLVILFLAFFEARKISIQSRKIGAPPWISNLAAMLQLSIFAFCLGGAALSFAYFDLIFAIFGIVLVLKTRILPAFREEAIASHNTENRNS